MVSNNVSTDIHSFLRWPAEVRTDDDMNIGAHNSYKLTLDDFDVR